MFLSKKFYIWNSGKHFADACCDLCSQRPAVRLEADCHGDSIALCKKHWTEWFKNELLAEFDKTDNEYKEVPEIEKKYVNLGKVYTLEL